MAVDYAVYIYNHLPRKDLGLSPMDLYSGSKWPIDKVHDLHVWGCPLYVLDPAMQDGKKLPRWKPRSRRGVFLGLSPKHSSNVPLVLKIATGHISPQYHCVFDDWFSTVATDVDKLPDLEAKPWSDLFEGSRFQYPFDDGEEPTLDDEFKDTEDTKQERRKDEIRQAQDQAHSLLGPDGRPPADPDPPVVSSPSAPSTPQTSALRESPRSESISRESPLQATPPRTSDRRESTTPPSPRRVSFHPDTTPTVSERREKETTSTSVRTQPRRSPRLTAQVESQLPSRYPRRSTRGVLPSNLDVYELNSLSQSILDLYEDDPSRVTQEFCGFVASKSDPDTLRWHEAQKSPDWDKFYKAADDEIQGLIKNGTWVYANKSEAKAAGKQILPGTWTFKRKRRPNGDVKKYKSRWCARGDLEDTSDMETYAPVVSWSTVRLLLYFVLQFGLKTKCADFSQAFVQATLEDPIYMHLPRGFEDANQPDSCLKLIKSLYGISQAPRLWFQHLKKNLEAQGFVQSTYDHCLFYSKHITLVVFVDDIVCAFEDEDKVNKLFKALNPTGDKLTDEGTLQEFLGIDVRRSKDGKEFELTQKGLIEKILKTTNLSECNPNWVPAAKQPLAKDLQGEPFGEQWSYSSVIGMLMYLTNNSRPDLAFAVNQCARFVHNPKKSHAVAVKMILRYLARTRNMGMIIRPNGTLALDCYVDADYCGLYKVEDDLDPTCAKSRSGYIITVGGCPLTWTSRLQTEVALSTGEAEFVALSTSLRELLPLKGLVQEMSLAIGRKDTYDAVTHSNVWEDNNAALKLAQTSKFTLRNRYYAAKYHWFACHVDSGAIRVKRIATTDQLADLFTKGLERTAFERLRNKIMGWPDDWYKLPDDWHKQKKK